MIRTPTFPVEVPRPANKLQEALDNYQEMERDRNDAVSRARELQVANGSLHAEVNMLRESLERADSDRVRLQAISSTLMGQLMAINAVIGDAVKLSIKNGIEAVAATRTEEQAELNKAGEEAQGILQRVRVSEATLSGKTNPEPPHGRPRTNLEAVSWRDPIG